MADKSDKKHEKTMILVAIAVVVFAFVIWLLLQNRAPVPVAANSNVLPVATDDSAPTPPSYIGYNVPAYNPTLPSIGPTINNVGTGCCPGCAGGDGGVMSSSTNNYYSVLGFGSDQGAALPLMG